jgi:hypothetical protein
LFGSWRCHPEEKHAIWIEAELDLPQVEEAANEQSCGHQQHQRNNDLRHHQCSTQGIRVMPRSAPPPLFSAGNGSMAKHTSWCTR